uniref:Fe2OG dioxygenase domain-containing protein n=1 Tax=Alexandrium catenella TaxID=2925 RepID=A0A7S1QC09_ALECA|mmetsp:Transcript_23766/g.64692  ORF Transcript_23766/g.64692 Transcript_23766/m.64692 type:complete len:337 (+) Transcript_23766:70-1080(+)
MPKTGRFTKKDKDKEEAPKERVLPKRQQKLDLPNALCVLVENYFTIVECEHYYKALSELDWRKQQIAVGKRDGDAEAIVAEPRLTLFMSDPGICYEYSGRENIGQGWHPTILEIKEKAERSMQELGQPPVVFNSVQLNRYNGPRHTLGMHADDEPDLLAGAPIVSVSFGCTREFRIQRRNSTSERTIELPDGSLLLMGDTMQAYYLHGVPPGGQTGLRFNLTFRVCVPRGARTASGAVLLQEGRGGRSTHSPLPEPSKEVADFLQEHDFDQRATGALLGAPLDSQRYVLSRGSLRDARNPSSALLSRLRDARVQAASGAAPREELLGIPGAPGSRR